MDIYFHKPGTEKPCCKCCVIPPLFIICWLLVFVFVFLLEAFQINFVDIYLPFQVAEMKFAFAFLGFFGGLGVGVVISSYNSLGTPCTHLSIHF